MEKCKKCSYSCGVASSYRRCIVCFDTKVSDLEAEVVRLKTEVEDEKIRQIKELASATLDCIKCDEKHGATLKEKDTRIKVLEEVRCEACLKLAELMGWQKIGEIHCPRQDNTAIPCPGEVAIKERLGKEPVQSAENCTCNPFVLHGRNGHTKLEKGQRLSCFHKKQWVWNGEFWEAKGD